MDDQLAELKATLASKRQETDDQLQAQHKIQKAETALHWIIRWLAEDDSPLSIFFEWDIVGAEQIERRIQGRISVAVRECNRQDRLTELADALRKGRLIPPAGPAELSKLLARVLHGIRFPIEGLIAEPLACAIETGFVAELQRNLAWALCTVLSDPKSSAPIDPEGPACEKRDEQWLTWHEQEGLGPAVIRDRWNGMTDDERRAIAPLGFAKIGVRKAGRQVVEKQLKRLKEKRELKRIS